MSIAYMTPGRQLSRRGGTSRLGPRHSGGLQRQCYFLADLNRALERFGNRGYRAAQLEAGIMGGKLNLVAYAQRLGASAAQVLRRPHGFYPPLTPRGRASCF
jgi:hypothetical protein